MLPIALWLDRIGGCYVGEENVEKNTSEAYVESAGSIAGVLASSSESGSSLFVINLCASMAPVQLTSKTLPGLENYRLYQVARAEDGRTRHRLRLGFFATENEADEVLMKVRERYPTAFTACLCEEDRRYTRGYVAAPPKPAMTIVQNTSPKPATPVAAATKAPSIPPSQPPAKPAAAATPAAKAAPAPATPPVPNRTRAAAQSPKPAPATKQQHGNAAAPQTKRLAGLDEMSWDPPALGASAARAGGTGKHTIIAPGTKTQPVIKAEPAKAKNPSTPPANKPATHADPGASLRVRALELSLSDPPPPTAAAPARGPSHEPFHVGKGIELPASTLSLQADAGPSANGAAASNPNGNNRAVAAANGSSKRAPSAPAARPSAPAAAGHNPAKQSGGAQAAPAFDAAAKHPDLDSTQTIRALTSAELNDESQEKCFAIQLAASEQPVNLDTMPHLDIFEAYRLYSVAIAGSGKIVHSLRLGFFKEAVSAEAVAGYLKTFFSAPTVLRISIAEQARFKDATVPKKPEPAAANTAKVVELSDARASRTPVPTVTMEVAAPKIDTGATGSFRMHDTGSFRTSETARLRTLGAGVKPAAKHAAPATKRSQPLARSRSSTSGKYKMPQKKSLTQALLEEAQEVELSESGIRKLPKNDSLLSRLVDRLKK